ncbi:MAG: hypothetical protein AABN95_03705 [Acidobacteriota bacterium]
MVIDTQNLNDDMVKLVAYSIVSVRRGRERILEGGEGTLVITGRMSGNTFTSYIIGRYLQTEVTNDKDDAIREVSAALDCYLRKTGEQPDVRRFAEALKNYLGDALAGKSTVTSIGKKYRQIPEEDRKYLRVHYVVSTRWPREPEKFEERQIAVLEEIGQAIGAAEETTST